ncbi:MAG: polysaccharide deacetylase family protein [Cyanobacteria bacterium SZAS LIN-5]|nr:polysaccharide deacetylase family protein [Cyanobacteria bacterium SZAS LIN-5]
MIEMQAAPPFLRSLQAPRVLMLLYHRISDTDADPQLLSVAPAHFREHLEVLRQKYRALNCSALDGGKEAFTTNSVVITFDDGYADNLTAALPILSKYEVPATVFISTGMVQHRTPFWWSEVESIIFGANALPDQVRLNLSEMREWNLNESSTASNNTSNGQSLNDLSNALSGWNLLCEHDPGPRHEIYREVTRFLRDATERERARVLDELKFLAGLNPPDGSNPVAGSNPLASPCQSLTVDEIVELSKSSLIELGSHTVNHPVLSRLSIAEQTFELRESKQFLEDVVGHSIDGFAYPYGTRADYTSETVSIAKQLSYKYACSNIPEAIWPGTDRFQLPRLLVRDCDGDYFEKWLSEWFGEC